MKKKSTSKSAFFNLRILTASMFCLLGIAVALFAQGNRAKQTQQNNRSGTRQDAPGTQTPEVTQMIGPVVVNGDLRDLPYVPPGPKIDRPLLKPYLHRAGAQTESEETPAFPQFQSLLGKIFRPVPNMPPPLLTFDGISSAESFCGCIPPDTNGDVGPNHYVETTNVAIKIFDKSGNTLLASVPLDTFFGPLGTTPCGTGLNQGDPFSFYDPLADRWVVSDFGFLSFGGNPSYECIGVSQTSDPVAGGWFLYAVLVDPIDANDYPKAAMWSEPAPGGAYHFTYNMWTSLQGPFTGVKVQALDRAAMLAGQQNPTVVTFKIPLDGLPDAAYSLVAAGFRTGSPPPAGRDEFLLAVRSGFASPATFSDVLGWLFHVDFVTPANSTIGIGTDHSPNAMISVNTYTEAWDASLNDPFALVPQSGTTAKVDTLGDKIMTPVVYQNRNGTESLWADQTTILNYPNGPTAVSWYQFDVTGGTFPATAAQQQEWTNGGDGLWRFMPSIAVDQNGNAAIGYATSSASIHPGIRYAGRLETDPPNDLGQGEAVLIDGPASQPSTRWGDYSMTTLDTDGVTFWHANEYYNAGWKTRIGKFDFVGGPSPTPTATATATASATPTPIASPTPRTTPTPRPPPTVPPRP